MTTNELKELLARAIANDNGRRDPDPIDKCNADAVIEALTPMMGEVAEVLKQAKAENELGSIVFRRPASHVYADTIASLPDCWREKGGV
jgi:hypothetical protein